MTKPVEFSQFYRLLNAAKEGVEGKKTELDSIIGTFKESSQSESPLHELGERFISIGVIELYKYADTEDIQEIGLIESKDWDSLMKKKGSELPIYLANKMISYAKDNSLGKEISKKWNVPEKQIIKEVIGMARYITEGILDAIE